MENYLSAKIVHVSLPVFWVKMRLCFTPSCVMRALFVRLVGDVFKSCFKNSRAALTKLTLLLDMR